MLELIFKMRILKKENQHYFPHLSSRYLSVKMIYISFRLCLIPGD